MTIADAFKAFVRALIGETPVGDNIAEIINDGAAKVSDAVLKYEDSTNKSFIINSSTEESTKQFRITVDDSGTITATEIVAETPEE